MKVIKKITAFLLMIVFTLACINTSVYADSSIRRTYDVFVNGEEVGEIPVLDLNYDNNMYFSLKSIAYYLKETNKAITVSVKDDEIQVITGQSYYEEPSQWTSEQLKDRPKWKLKRTPFFIDEAEKKYYSITGPVGEEGSIDAFFNPLRLAMALDVNIEVESGKISIDTEDHFSVSDVELDNSGYLQGVNSLLIGNGTTGDVYFDYCADKIVPIASTTKLMTYFVMMDAVTNGEITLDDDVNISDEARRLSESIDGLVSFEGVNTVPLSELVDAMLLPSCNECALAIAEHVSGSEEDFVIRMNEKAKELGLEYAEFYNSNGLPVYEKQLLPAKMQNHMTAKDMFVICSELVKKYPHIMNITSKKEEDCPTLGYTAKNTNALLYNMDEVKGLKTGTTNKSGACVTIVMPVEKDGVTNNLICVLFGAEGEFDRALIAELASRIALTKLDGTEIVTEEKYTITPDDPELDVERMLRNLK